MGVTDPDLAGPVAPPREDHPAPVRDQTPAQPRQPPGPEPRPPRRRRWPRRLLRGGLALLVIAGATLASAELATPPVTTAPALVTAIDRAHHSEPISVDPSWRVARAIVAAEDAGFYANHGIDLGGMVRGLWGKLTGRDLGGSTITEQLAKAIYESGRTDLVARVAEVALALKLEGHYGKQAILSMYMSAIYYGHGFYGVLAASEGYFGLPPGRLSWGQAALLAGLPQAPSLLDPLRHLSLARERQGYVLGRLVANGVLSRAKAGAAARAPLGLR